MDKILHVALPNAPITQMVVDGATIYCDPLAGMLSRVHARFTHETVRINEIDLKGRLVGEVVADLVLTLRDHLQVLVTCHYPDLVAIATAVRDAMPLHQGQHVVVTAGDPVIQKGSDGAINLLMALGVLRGSRFTSNKSLVYTVWQGDVVQFVVTRP